MRLFTRMIMRVAAALVLFTVTFHVADSWFGEDTSMIGAGRIILLESRRSHALRARAEMVSRSLSVKKDIIDQLLAGRLRFSQAVVQFHKANELIENLDLDLIPAYLTPSDAEGVARQVFKWAGNSVTTWPSDKARPLLAELECEYQRLFPGSGLEEATGERPMDKNSTGRPEANVSAR